MELLFPGCLSQQFGFWSKYYLKMFLPFILFTAIVLFTLFHKCIRGRFSSLPVSKLLVKRFVSFYNLAGAAMVTSLISTAISPLQCYQIGQSGDTCIMYKPFVQVLRQPMELPPSSSVCIYHFVLCFALVELRSGCRSQFQECWRRMVRRTLWKSDSMIQAEIFLVGTCWCWRRLSSLCLCIMLCFRTLAQPSSSSPFAFFSDFYWLKQLVCHTNGISPPRFPYCKGLTLKHFSNCTLGGAFSRSSFSLQLLSFYKNNWVRKISLWRNPDIHNDPFRRDKYFQVRLQSQEKKKSRKEASFVISEYERERSYQQVSVLFIKWKRSSNQRNSVSISKFQD